MTALGICVEWFITFIEVAMCNYFMRIFFVDQYPKKKQRVIYIIVASAITTGVIMLNLLNLSFSMATVVYVVVINAIGGCVLYKGKFADFLVVSLSFVTGLNILEWSMLQVVSVVWSPEIPIKMQEGFSLLRVFIISMAKMIDIAVCMLLGTFLKKMMVRVKKTRWALIGAVAAFFSSLYMFKISDIYSDLRLYPVQTVLTVVLVFALCFAYLFYRLKLIQTEQTFTIRQNALLQKNYEAAQISYETNAKLYHDMNNHFAVLQSYLADGKVLEAQDYLEKISGSKAVQNVECFTGIEAVDYILSQKMFHAKQRQIEVSANVEYPKDCSIEPVDLCTILTNLLDNAIEGTERETEQAERRINITIRRIHQFILIRISNRSVSSPVIQNGRLVTTKKNKQHHGWGMKSVISAAEKYNGAVEYSYEDFMFTVSVMLCYS